MNINSFESIILNIILLILLYPLVKSSTTCSIFPSLNCSCFQSNYDLTSTLPIKIYSHLYCKGNILTKNTFQSPFGSDYKHQNRFRTISIEFLHEKQIEIHTNQFDSLAMLFSLTEKTAQIELSLRFNNFTYIKFNKQAITSNIFQKKHQNIRLWLYFQPTTDSNQINSGDDNLDQFQFSQNSFSGLIISQLNMYIHTSQDHFSSSSSFEHVFNNTNIGEVHFHGTIIPPDSSTTIQPIFKGLIKSLTLHRRVDTIDSNSFPYYPSVLSYNIHSIEAHSMDLNSFIPRYHNLRGLELIKPRFEVSIDKLIPTLDSLLLDIEYVNERTLLGAQHIHYLKLGSRLRRIHSQVFHSLPKHLRLFDLSDINLSEMTTDSLCLLIQFIYNTIQQQLNIIYPRIETLTECNCARLILNDIRSKIISKDHLPNESICSKQCRFSICPIISEHFREKYPLVANNFNFNDDLPSIDLYSDPSDIALMSFLANQTELNSKRTTSTTSRTNSQHLDENKRSKSSKITDYFSWITILISIISILFLVIIIISIIFCIRRHRKQNEFTVIPVYVTD
ncbi:hypothetical protein I4U23_006160 [Adineta vaga]|nr:hypothetical protein I4U23_006160 [Adineta vaga]